MLSLEGRAEVPFGSFSDALITRNFTPLEPNVVELKLYARSVGPVLVVQTSGGASREELVTLHEGLKDEGPAHAGPSVPWESLARTGS